MASGNPAGRPASGVVGAYDGQSQAVKTLIVFFAGLTIYNALELVMLIFTTFKSRKTLYFWSLLISSVGLIPYAVGFMLKLLGTWNGRARWPGVILITIGWYAMVTGQSVVLWSRLHLITKGERGHKILKFTKWMIIVDVIILHVPTSVVTFGSNGNLATSQFIKAYNVIEKFQMTGFCVQEAILSSIYIIETLGVLRTSLRSETRAIMRQLVSINVAIILMDVGLLSIEYASLFLLETILKGFVYSMKLKIEFAILSRLVKFVGGGREEPLVGARAMSVATIKTQGKAAGSEHNTTDISEFVDLSKMESDNHKYAARSWDHQDETRSGRGSKKDLWEIEDV